MPDRRAFLGTLAASALPLSRTLAAEEKPKGIRQVIAAWPFFSAAKWSPADLVHHAKALGVAGVELFPIEEWPLLKEAGLVCAATKSHTFVRGMNHKGHHAECFDALTKAIVATGEWGFPNVMTFTGMADTSDQPNGGVVDPEEGMRNCIEGYKKMAALAEKHKVSMVLEPLNSRVAEDMKGHPGYQGDHIDYCMEIVRAVSSPGLKILFDAYHIQIMDGDLIRRFEKYAEFVGHVQVAGNPGRGYLGPDQEIHYPALMKTILKSGYSGYVGHEWIPGENPLEELKQSIEACNV
ncbi:hydroxypyruvate isomerase [Haloferula helveola]|uniref:Hydroxypyruvate isomerase n=1 Tax=Haloferula helveola TaxID=490095 RepID=A0ABN6H1Z1_9BACT|nr:hydroxypyruvate isomerase [Haloferula helveola]